MNLITTHMILMGGIFETFFNGLSDLITESIDVQALDINQLGTGFSRKKEIEQS